MRKLMVLIGWIALAGCGAGPAAAPSADVLVADGLAGDALAADGGGQDATGASDAGSTDASGPSGDSVPADATAQGDAPLGDSAGSDAAAPLGKATAWGTVSGACGVVAAELASPNPSFHVNTYQFGPGAFDPKPLRTLAQKRYSGPNAGGSSKCSEAMSMQLLFDCEGILGLKTELEIAFTQPGQTTDWLGQLGASKVGVSVSRAYQGPTDTTFTVVDAETLLKKKLGGIQESSQLVAPADKWVKQILHIWTLQPTWVPTLKAAWAALDPSLRGDTVIVVTIESGSTAITADNCGAK